MGLELTDDCYESGILTTSLSCLYVIHCSFF